MIINCGWFNQFGQLTVLRKRSDNRLIQQVPELLAFVNNTANRLNQRLDQSGVPVRIAFSVQLF
jgi:hypothetical protein